METDIFDSVGELDEAGYTSINVQCDKNMSSLAVLALG